ncbi:hypothetical protein [uncultured Mediterranean phage uvDeep-CGR2-KM18-C74]|nr:hypothetical protein [uncultured Mediterranean phage uvDeep-CGR2-KM18-C74]
MAFDAKSNEATLEALEKARGIINGAINTVRDWQRDNNGNDFTASAKAAKLALVTDMDSDGVATELATAKTWDGKATA